MFRVDSAPNLIDNVVMRLLPTGKLPADQLARLLAEVAPDAIDAMPEDAARCMAAGMDAHLAKPVTHDRLYAAIDQTFRAAASR